MRLTTFPSQNVVINFTLFVVIFTAVSALYLGALDLGFGEAILQGINNYRTGAPAEVATTTASTTPTASTSIFTPTQVSTTSVPNNILVK